MPTGVYTRTKKHRRIISASLIRRWQNPLFRSKMIGKPSSRKGTKHTLESRQKMSLSHIGKDNHRKGTHHSDVTCTFLSEYSKKLWLNIDYRNKNKTSRGSHSTRTAEWCANTRLRLRKQWTNPDWRKKTIRNVLKASHYRPNGSEQKLLSILQKHMPQVYRYVGDGSLLVGTMNPDFAHATESKVVELYGNFWHRGDNPQLRIDAFKKYGYDCLVIWEAELNELTNLLRRITEFTTPRLIN